MSKSASHVELWYTMAVTTSSPRSYKSIESHEGPPIWRKTSRKSKTFHFHLTAVDYLDTEGARV